MVKNADGGSDGDVVKRSEQVAYSVSKLSLAILPRVLSLTRQAMRLGRAHVDLPWHQEQRSVSGHLRSSRGHTPVALQDLVMDLRDTTTLQVNIHILLYSFAQRYYLSNLSSLPMAIPFIEIRAGASRQ